MGADSSGGGGKAPSGFCTRENLSCPLHPSRRGAGCTPCIAKNLRLGEIPNCFFNPVEGSGSRAGDGFEDFARLVLEGGAGGAGEAFSGAFRRRRAAGGSPAVFFCARFPRDGRDLPAGRGFRVFAKKTQKNA